MKNIKCFIISPIGLPESDTRKHADRVLRFIIEPAINIPDLDIDLLRSDQMNEPGRITNQMFREILTSQLCVVLLTEENPNVYYELAVAQCAARPIVLLLEQGKKPPFDVKDLRIVAYDFTDPDRVSSKTDVHSLQNHILHFKNMNWVSTSLFSQYPYGPQLEDLNKLQRNVETHRPEALEYNIDKSYYLNSNPKKKICLITGSIEYVKNIDVVVSSENTDFQLARFFDTSISGTLRYLDAEKDPGGTVIQCDSLNESLQRIIKELGIYLPVQPATVIANQTNRLLNQGIKFVFHVATVRGSLGHGYRIAIDRIDACIANTYRKFSELSQEHELHSIVLPLIGAGSAKEDPVKSARNQMKAVIREMDISKTCEITYLLAWKDTHLKAYRIVARELGLEENP